MVDLLWNVLVVIVACCIVLHGDSLPRLIVWPARCLLGLMSIVIHVAAVAALWVDCALPYRSFYPVPGGPGMRPVAYHPQLQERVGSGSKLDWLNWWAGMLLRGVTFLLVALAVVCWLGWRFQIRSESAGFFLSYNLGIILGALVACPGINLFMRGLRAFWRGSEPPGLETEQSSEAQAIGVARPEPGWNRRLRAVIWRVTPLPTFLLVLTAGPLLTFPEQGLRLALLGLALGALLGYPVWTWSGYWSRRVAG